MAPPRPVSIGPGPTFFRDYPWAMSLSYPSFLVSPGSAPNRLLPHTPARSLSFSVADLTRHPSPIWALLFYSGSPLWTFLRTPKGCYLTPTRRDL